MFSAANSGLVGGIGLVLSIIGLLVTSAGFIITIYQIRQTRSATEAVRAKTDKIKDTVSMFDVSLDITRATKALEQVVAFNRAKNLALVLAPLAEAQLLLSRISKILSQDIETSKITRESSEFLLNQIQFIEESIDKQIDFDSVELMSIARRSINTLDSKLIDFQKGLYNA